MVDADALKAAEVALSAAMAAVVAAEHDGAAPVEPVKPSIPPVTGGEPGPDAPPADDAHVAVGCSLFSDPTKLKEAPKVDSVYLGHIGEPATKGKDY